MLKCLMMTDAGPGVGEPTSYIAPRNNTFNISYTKVHPLAMGSPTVVRPILTLEYNEQKKP